MDPGRQALSHDMQWKHSAVRPCSCRMFAAHSGELEAMERCCITAQLRVALAAGLSPAEMRPVVTQMHTDLHEFNLSQPRATQHCELRDAFPGCQRGCKGLGPQA